MSKNKIQRFVAAGTMVMVGLGLAACGSSTPEGEDRVTSTRLSTNITQLDIILTDGTKLTCVSKSPGGITCPDSLIEKN